MIKIKKAFSLIEVIFVLIILAIVASISSQIIVQVYENYIIQNALYKTSTKTEMAINQIVNRLSFALEGTTISKDPLSTLPYTKANETINWLNLKDIDLTLANFRRFTTIEWIGYDNDSFAAGEAPYWTGLANYDARVSRDSFETPGSTLSNAATIMSNLSNGEVQLTATNPAALLFMQQSSEYATGKEYDPACMGLVNENNTTCIFPVRIGTTDNNLTFTRLNEPKIITEHYKLAWSAYALVPEDPDGDNLFDLNLYSNYQPWNNETYQNNGTKNLLINNVSVFKFTKNGGVIQIKLCASEDIGERNATGSPIYISTCKEKAIIR